MKFLTTIRFTKLKGSLLSLLLAAALFEIGGATAVQGASTDSEHRYFELAPSAAPPAPTTGGGATAPASAAAPKKIGKVATVPKVIAPPKAPGNPSTFDPNKQIGKRVPAPPSGGSADVGMKARDIFKKAKDGGGAVAVDSAQAGASERTSVAADAAPPGKKRTIPKAGHAVTEVSPRKGRVATENAPISTAEAASTGKASPNEKDVKVVVAKDPPRKNKSVVKGGSDASVTTADAAGAGPAPSKLNDPKKVGRVADLTDIPKNVPGSERPSVADLGRGKPGTGLGQGEFAAGTGLGNLPGRVGRSTLEDMAKGPNDGLPTGGFGPDPSIDPSGSLGDLGSAAGVVGKYVPGAAGSATRGAGKLLGAADKIAEGGSIGEAAADLVGAGGTGLGEAIDFAGTGRNSAYQGAVDKGGMYVGALIVGGVIAAVFGVGLIGLLVAGAAGLLGADQTVGSLVSSGLDKVGTFGRGLFSGSGGEGLSADEGSALDQLAADAQKYADDTAKAGAKGAAQEDPDAGAQEPVDDGERSTPVENTNPDQKPAETPEEKPSNSGGQPKEGEQPAPPPEDEAQSAGCGDERYEQSKGPTYLSPENRARLAEKMGRDPLGEHRDGPGRFDVEPGDMDRQDYLKDGDPDKPGGDHPVSKALIDAIKESAKPGPCPTPDGIGKAAKAAAAAGK